ncbi:MAG: MerR family transcriptional regulator [Planctomycetota bacterium]|jgi:DNA-binding transcriptional MerR regulator
MAARGVTIGALGKTSGLARSTLLYYDRLGLLRPKGRTRGNYRFYTQADVDRLEQICLYRSMGIPLKDIAHLLKNTGRRTAVAILKRRLQALESEINDLRRQQRCIVSILKQGELRKETDMLTKDRWVAVMRAAGLNDEAMHNWHIQFEKMEPDAHQEFLESLGIDQAEVERIRDWARQA